MDEFEFTQDYTATLVKCMLNNFSNKFENKIICLEIGCFEGLGSIKIFQYLCHNLKSKLYCIDPWDDNLVKNSKELSDHDKYYIGQYDRFKKNTKDYPRIIELRGYSKDLIKTIPELVDFCYIDGSNIEEDKYIDCIEVYNKMNYNGIILINNYSWEYNNIIPKNGIDRFLNEYKKNLEILEIGHGLTVKVKKNIGYFGSWFNKIDEPVSLINIKIIKGNELDTLFSYSNFSMNPTIKINIEFELKYINSNQLIDCINKLFSFNFIKQKLILPERSTDISQFMEIINDNNENNYTHDDNYSYYHATRLQLQELYEKNQKLTVIFYKN